MSTTSLTIEKPESTEHGPYYSRYISQVKSNDVLTYLARQAEELSGLLASRSEHDGDFRYAPDKWTVKEVVGHVNDAERVFAYRALRISRNDKTPLAGFEQDDYVREGPFRTCQLSDLVEDFRQVRGATLSLLRILDQEAWLRRGVASNFEVTVRALAYIIAGHARHHQTILEEKYFSLLHT